MYSYAPALIKSSEQSETKIIPLRYQLRPRNSSTEFPSHINAFNARIDSLDMRQNWRRLFMRAHAAVLLKGFFEWVVGPEQKKVVVEFIPGGFKYSWVAALWDRWESHESKERMDSFAILTRDPPLEVARVGHDRSPQFMDSYFLNSWLSPEKRNAEDYYQYFKKDFGMTYETLL